MCDVQVRRLGNEHKYTVQCTLSMNMYTEKIYLILWYWMLFVALASAIGFVTCLLRLISHHDKTVYVKNHLNKTNDEINEHDLEGFINYYLGPDGMFLMRQIGHFTNVITVSGIMTELYTRFLKKKHKYLPTSPSKQENGIEMTDQLDKCEEQPLSP